ncbi:MAG TPA: response regulator [Phycisphaerae bacterium]|nr:response regulator [Phycisphaerae bacterium]
MAKRILLIDDDPDFVLATQTLLEANGYAVEVASNGTEAVELIEQGRSYDLFLIDAMMSTLTEGFELIYHLRNKPKTAKTPMIMLTSIEQRLGGQFEPAKDRQDLMLDAFLRKPVEPDELLNQIRTLLDDEDH